MALNARQQIFVSAYLAHKNATRAAIEAGYSEKTAHSQGPRLLENVEIKAALAQKVQTLTDKLDIGPEYILRSLREVAERCKQAIPVMEFDHETKTMKETGEWKFEHQGANKALELLGKYQKLWTDKIEIDDQSSLAEKVGRFKKHG